MCAVHELGTWLAFGRDKAWTPHSQAFVVTRNRLVRLWMNERYFLFLALDFVLLAGILRCKVWLDRLFGSGSQMASGMGRGLATAGVPDELA